MDVKHMHKFLKGLAANNSKEWMDAHKSDYHEARNNFLELVGQLIRVVSAFDPALVGLEPKDCVFRINRDIRFSKNKDPYKTNFGASMTMGGRKSGHPGYYLHIMPGNNFVGGGLYQPSTEPLKKIRQEIDYNADELRGIIDVPGFKKMFPEPYGDKVKTAPKGYSKDNPNIDLLRYKSFIYLRQFSDKETQSVGFPKDAVQTMKTMKSYLDFLRRALD